MTYVLLIYRTQPEVDPTQDRQSLAAHRALQRETSGRGELHAVARLDDATAAKTVRRREAAHEVSDGPYIESKEWLVGFYLLDCSGEAEALDRARTLCADDNHAIEVRPALWHRGP